jgi:hypothetical protein
LSRVVGALWGNDINYVALHKIYGGTTETEQRQYLPAVGTGIDKKVPAGSPETSTSRVTERNPVRTARGRGTCRPDGTTEAIEFWSVRRSCQYSRGLKR